MDFSLDLWISHWICGFLIGFYIGFVDFTLDLWILHWICGLYIGFVDFKLDLWILNWICGWICGFVFYLWISVGCLDFIMTIAYDISVVSDPSAHVGLRIHVYTNKCLSTEKSKIHVTYYREVLPI